MFLYHIYEIFDVCVGIFSNQYICMKLEHVMRFEMSWGQYYLGAGVYVRDVHRRIQ